jgi:hypothetical protein
MNIIEEAQNDMKNGYGYGSVGVLVSGLVWITAGAIATSYAPQKAIWALLIGGVLIFPLSTLIGKLIAIKAQHNKSNPLGKLAMEVTIWMIMCIPLAYGLSLIKAEWFFQGMLLIIGGRYLTFASIYGLRIYWILGAFLGLGAYVLFVMEANIFTSALFGGIIETIFGITIYVLYRNNKIKSV